MSVGLSVVGVSPRDLAHVRAFGSVEGARVVCVEDADAERARWVAARPAMRSRSC